MATIKFHQGKLSSPAALPRLRLHQALLVTDNPAPVTSASIRMHQAYFQSQIGSSGKIRAFQAYLAVSQPLGKMRLHQAFMLLPGAERVPVFKIVAGVWTPVKPIIKFRS